MGKQSGQRQPRRSRLTSSPGAAVLDQPHKHPRAFIWKHRARPVLWSSHLGRPKPRSPQPHMKGIRTPAIPEVPSTEPRTAGGGPGSLMPCSSSAPRKGQRGRKSGCAGQCRLAPSIVLHRTTVLGALGQVQGKQKLMSKSLASAPPTPQSPSTGVPLGQAGLPSWVGGRGLERPAGV